MKQMVVRRSIDSSKYVNMDTGETLASERPDITATTQSTDMVVVSYNEYVTIDSRAVEFIRREFNASETGRILAMADMVKGCYNILFNKKTNEPHCRETLSDDLEYSRNKFADFLKKLFDKSVVYYIKGVKGGKERVWIMLNPTLARKSKVFHKDCRNVFEDLCKK